MNSKSKKNKRRISRTVRKLLELLSNDVLGDQKKSYSYYQSLETKIVSLSQKKSEWDMIHKYVKNTSGPTHHFTVKIENIFTVRRRGEFQNYIPKKILGNRKLLWHGTKISNLASILKNGLLQQPPDSAGTNGKMFGEGIYFADVVTKAAQYCKATRNNPYGILILAEVALGESQHRTHSDNMISSKYCTNSVKAIGKYQPTENESVTTKHGAEIPLGTLKYNPNIITDLRYNEYIVYCNSQILFQYLVFVEFIFN